MKWLITGGFGFIGSALNKLLAAQGDSVVVIDNLQAGTTPDLMATGWAKMDVAGASREVLRAFIKKAAPEVIVHLAAETDVRESIKSPARHVFRNVCGVENMLNVAEDCGARFIFASSLGVAGNNQELPIRESVQPSPASPYAASKAIGEILCGLYPGVKSVRLRFSNVYGPGGEHKQGIIAKILRARKNGFQIPIYGEGKQTRDFVHVWDVARAIIMAGQSELGGVTLNICTGVETSVRRLVELAGIEDRVTLKQAIAGEVLRSQGCRQAAYHALGWKPLVEIESGLGELLATEDVR